MSAARKRRAPAIDLDLRDLSACGSRLHSSERNHFGTAASFCLRYSRSRGPIVLRAKIGQTTKQLRVQPHAITTAIRATYNDTQDATEHGAYGIALLVAAKELGLTFAERAYKGPGFDFFMYPPGRLALRDDDDIYAEQWGLEVTGIIQGGEREIKTRLKKKRKQVSASAEFMQVVVAVVEFSEPFAIFENQR